MTIAICTACGARKFGAFTPCDECGFTPRSNEELAKSVLLSDHYYSHAHLDEIGIAIKKGETIVYDPASVAQHVKALDMLNADADKAEKEGW